jgi:hypothetical protein
VGLVEGKVAIVTGVSGIGAACVTTLARVPRRWQRTWTISVAERRWTGSRHRSGGV